METSTPVLTATKMETLTPVLTATKMETSTPVLTATKMETLTPVLTAPNMETLTPVLTATNMKASTPVLTATNMKASTPVLTATNMETSTPVLTATKMETSNPVVSAAEVEAAISALTPTNYKQCIICNDVVIKMHCFNNNKARQLHSMDSLIRLAGNAGCPIPSPEHLFACQKCLLFLQKVDFRRETLLSNLKDFNENTEVRSGDGCHGDKFVPVDTTLSSTEDDILYTATKLQPEQPTPLGSSTTNLRDTPAKTGCGHACLVCQRPLHDHTYALPTMYKDVSTQSFDYQLLTVSDKSNVLLLANDDRDQKGKPR